MSDPPKASSEEPLGLLKQNFFYRDGTELEPRFGQEVKPNLNSNVQEPELNQTPPYKEPNRIQAHMSWFLFGSFTE